MSKTTEKLYAIAREQGYNKVEDLLMDTMLSGIVPGICMNEGCNAVYEYEPDQDEGYCHVCKTKTVKSCQLI